MHIKYLLQFSPFMTLFIIINLIQAITHQRIKSSSIHPRVLNRVWTDDDDLLVEPEGMVGGRVARIDNNNSLN